MQKKWTSLRSYFIRICSGNSNKKLAAGTIDHINWVHYDQMSFLLDAVQAEHNITAITGIVDLAEMSVEDKQVR